MTAHRARNKQLSEVGALMQHVAGSCEHASSLKHACQNASNTKRVRVFSPGLHCRKYFMS